MALVEGMLRGKVLPYQEGVMGSTAGRIEDRVRIGRLDQAAFRIGMLCEMFYARRRECGLPLPDQSLASSPSPVGDAPQDHPHSRRAYRQDLQ